MTYGESLIGVFMLILLAIGFVHFLKYIMELYDFKLILNLFFKILVTAYCLWQISNHGG